jgi:hypothetical protein
VSFTVESADHQQVLGRELNGYVVTAFANKGTHAYVLGVSPDGKQYAVFTVLPGPEESFVLTGFTRTFPASDYNGDHFAAFKVAAYNFAQVTA